MCLNKYIKVHCIFGVFDQWYFEASSFLFYVAELTTTTALFTWGLAQCMGA
jgi:hypothetical protein